MFDNVNSSLNLSVIKISMKHKVKVKTLLDYDIIIHDYDYLSFQIPQYG